MYARERVKFGFRQGVQLCGRTNNFNMDCYTNTKSSPCGFSVANFLVSSYINKSGLPEINRNFELGS